jgi:2-dehydro-3-deoxygluconokinase
VKVVAFGEALFRTSTFPGERLAQAQQLNFYLGGSELNLAANLQSLGVESKWVSALPAGPTGQLILEKIKALAVDTSDCYNLDDSRTGWYLMESGSAPRPDVVYHRNSSALASQTKFQFDWKAILKGADLFHSSGITAGLSEALTTEVKKALGAAKELGLLVSYDLNYRKNIWSLEAFVARQKDIFDKIDILFCAKSDLQLFFDDDFKSDNFSKVFENSKIQYLVMTQRSADNSEYGTVVLGKSEKAVSKTYRVNAIDRIGVGDSAAAGFIKMFLTNRKIEEAAEWAALSGALKYGIRGDMALLKETDLRQILNSTHTGVIR